MNKINYVIELTSEQYADLQMALCYAGAHAKSEGDTIYQEIAEKSSAIVIAALTLKVAANA